MEAVAKQKKKWRGAFNFNRVFTIEYAWAYTERQAWAVMCKRLANRDGVGFLSVMNIFDGSKDNYIIEEVTE